MVDDNNIECIEYFKKVYRAWFFTHLQGDGLEEKLEHVWHELKDNALNDDPADEATFLVRADIVEPDIPSEGFTFNVIAPASASSPDKLDRLRQKFQDRLQQLFDNPSIVVYTANVVTHIPGRPQEESPGYIAVSEMMSPVGKRKDNPWG